MQAKNKFLRLTLITFGSISLCILIAGVSLNYLINKKIKDAFDSLNIAVSSIQTNLFNTSVTVRDFHWTYTNDTLTGIPHSASVRKIQIQGVSLFQLILHRKVQAHHLIIDSGTFIYNNALKTAKENKGKEGLPVISIDLIQLRNCKAILAKDTVEEYSGTFDVMLRDFCVDQKGAQNDLSAFSMGAFEASLANVVIHEKGSMYRTKISKIAVKSEEKSILIDSVSLVPTVSKYEFSRKGGRQKDRIHLSIPKITIEGYQFALLKDSIVAVSNINITNADLHIFRDKRLPFIRENNVPLPMAMVKDLKFTVAVDSIHIQNASVVYEEFPEKGFRTGEIKFDKLDATLDHFTNREYYPKYTQAMLIATSRVTGNGKIEAKFSLPYSDSAPYNANGSIKDLEMPLLNPALENLAFTSIVSGKLNQLFFNFDYSEYQSRGSILINYENLKIKSLTKEKKSEANEFKTIVFNALLKNNKDRSMPNEKRTGAIDIERDRKRAIFQIWWKSILDGLRSSITGNNKN